MFLFTFSRLFSLFILFIFFLCLFLFCSFFCLFRSHFFGVSQLSVTFTHSISLISLSLSLSFSSYFLNRVVWNIFYLYLRNFTSPLQKYTISILNIASEIFLLLAKYAFLLLLFLNYIF